MKKITVKIVSIVAAALCMMNTICVAETLNTDINSDGKTNVFDYVILKRQSAEIEKIQLLRDFLLGREVDLEQEENQYPIDESAILEPKGTVHYGEGTFYGGGYVGGCAMLDPVPTDIWVAAMNIADYNNAQLAGAYIEKCL